MKDFTKTEDLQKIIEGGISGEEAANALRQARTEYNRAQDAIMEHNRLIWMAEARLIYGEAGRPS